MEVQYTKNAFKYLSKLPKNIKISIIDAINNIPSGDIKEMKGFLDNRKRLRVGKYRVIYKINDDTNVEILLVMDVGSRGDIYK